MYKSLSFEIRPSGFDTFPSAYTIDDGNGGKIHVNVSEIFALPKLEHSCHFKGQFVSCVHSRDRLGFNMKMLGRQGKILGIQDLSKRIARGRLSITPLG